MRKVLLAGKDICREFQGNTGGMVLNHVTLDIYAGDFTVIMGSSGAGKSTLLYALSGMDEITGGEIWYKGREISRFKEKQMSDLRIHEFGFVFQQTHLVSNLTLYENIVVAGYLGTGRKAKEVDQRADELLCQMGVEKAKGRLPSEVSGGEAQRAAIARAVINRPGILFADEPTGALNRQNTQEVLNLLTGLNETGQSVLMVTHDVRAAIRGSRILYLEDGKILDELNFPAYRNEAAKDREIRLNEWLCALSW